MLNPIPKPKENLAIIRFEVVCHVKTLRETPLPLADCLRDACSRPWPDENGRYYSYRTIETWWYDYAKSGFKGLSGTATRRDAGQCRLIDQETGEWILDAMDKSPGIPFSVLYRTWDEHGRGLPSESTVRRFLKSKGYDARSFKAGRLETGPQKAFEVPLSLRARKIELRYPLSFEPVEVWHQESFHGLARRCNLHLNSQNFHKGENYAR